MKKIIILLLLLYFSECVFAQTDTNTVKSVSEVLEQKWHFDSNRIVDSIRYLKILEEINKLKEKEF